MEPAEESSAAVVSSIYASESAKISRRESERGIFLSALS
jgi:hypothetical protein